MYSHFLDCQINTNTVSASHQNTIPLESSSRTTLTRSPSPRLTLLPTMFQTRYRVSQLSSSTPQERRTLQSHTMAHALLRISLSSSLRTERIRSRLRHLLRRRKQSCQRPLPQRPRKQLVSLREPHRRSRRLLRKQQRLLRQLSVVLETMMSTMSCRRVAI